MLYCGLQFIIDGSQDRHLEAGADGEAVASSAQAPPTTALLDQSLIKTMYRRLNFRPFLEAFSQLRFHFPKCLSLVPS